MLWYYNQEFRWGRHTCDWILIEIFDICKLCSIFNRRTFLMNRLLRSWEGTTYIWGRISRSIWLITSYGLYKVIVRDEKILKSFIEDVLLEEVCDSGFPGGAAAAAATLLQLCPTLCDPIDRSPPGSPRPWDSPGKNTGVGCHFLLQCMKVKSESEVAQSCPTLSDPMDCSPPGSSVQGVFQARGLEWGAVAFSAQVVLVVKKKKTTLPVQET